MPANRPYAMGSPSLIGTAIGVPFPDWDGSARFVDAAMMKAHLASPGTGSRVLVCGGALHVESSLPIAHNL
jgi:hypothetical protein